MLYAMKDQIALGMLIRHRRLGMAVVNLNSIYQLAGETSCRKKEEVTGKTRRNLS
jgi:hypothetical protein